jgi:hypothetical protein
LKAGLFSQAMLPFIENQKWGYKLGQKIIIEAAYDTVFAFDKTNQIAMVANKSKLNKSINPLSGQEEFSYDYHYIDQKNNKIKLMAGVTSDSVFTFSNQQEFQSAYRDSSGYFKILHEGKVYLMSKKGKQLSPGFENITETKTKGYFETENYAKFEKKVVRVKGLIDSTGLQVVKCKYHQIKINPEDSSVYCCSAVFDAKQNDDVFNYKGKLIYSSQKHIEFSSKTLHVVKSYSPREEFIVDNSITGEKYYLEGTKFRYIQKNRALLIHNKNCYLIDLVTQKRQKLDKEAYMFSLLLITGK